MAKIFEKLKEGYLDLKKGHGIYEKYYYRLQYGKLFEYINEFSLENLQCYHLNEVEKLYRHKLRPTMIIIEFKNKTLELKAKNEDDADSWMTKLYE